MFYKRVMNPKALGLILLIFALVVGVACGSAAQDTTGSEDKAAPPVAANTAIPAATESKNIRHLKKEDFSFYALEWLCRQDYIDALLPLVLDVSRQPSLKFAFVLNAV